MAQRYQVKLDGNGEVSATVLAHDGDPLPAGYIDATALSSELKATIDARTVRWDGTQFAAKPLPPPRPPASSLTDRQLLESLARAMGLAR